MEHALFLDKPIRSNPRRRAQALAVSMLPSPPCEIASPAPGIISSQSTLVRDSDEQLTSTTDKSTTEHMDIIASMTRPRWRTETDLVINSASPDRTPQESSATPGPSRQRRGKATKAACSTCRKRKSKCDGKRPTCTSCSTRKKSCEYLTEEGVSSQAAYKTRLEDYATVLRLLKRADRDECGRILEDLRRPKSTTDAVKDVLERWVEDD
ncbi:hypothetical protein E4T44_06518 [Aureobasidium sp. EXF-8845]|nr:hypothetical protein E4T44_06518 [Aureobasidium sp. EXF-8845]KAI4855748.1 hypothetical protein E4T45_02807 [Aureobasidium sp. EXF-8846]